MRGLKIITNRKKKSICIEDFHIGFKYQQLQMDGSRYLNRGMIWVEKVYGFESPRLYKMKKLIEEGKIKRSSHE